MSTAEILQKQAAPLQRWTVAPDRSTVEFTVPHAWGLSKVSGRFHRFDGRYVVEPGHSSIALSIDSSSVDTGNAVRDKHLRGSDFFNAERHVWIRFTSTAVSDQGNGQLRVTGVLDIGGTQIPLGLDATQHQYADRLEIDARGTVDQRDFGMSRGPLWSIRHPTSVHVKAVLVPSPDVFE